MFSIFLALTIIYKNFIKLFFQLCPEVDCPENCVSQYIYGLHNFQDNFLWGSVISLIFWSRKILSEIFCKSVYRVTWTIFRQDYIVIKILNNQKLSENCSEILYKSPPIVIYRKFQTRLYSSKIIKYQ